MTLATSKTTLLLVCLAVALSTPATGAATHHLGAARKLLDGVSLKKFDSLISLKRLDGNDITPASLYSSLRDTFNGYFLEPEAEDAESPAGAVEMPEAGAPEAAEDMRRSDLEIFMLTSRPERSRRLHQAAAAKKAPAAPVAKPAAAAAARSSAAPVVVDMTTSPMQKFMLSSRPASNRAKIEGPADEGGAPVFDGSGKQVSGGRKLSQAAAIGSSRVSLTPQATKAMNSAPARVPGRVSIDNSGNAAAAGRPMTQPLSGRKLAQTKSAAPSAVKSAAPAKPAQQGAAAQFLASRTTAPKVVDMSNSQLQKTLLAPPNANGQRAKIEGPADEGGAPVFDGSGKQVSGGRKLSQATTTKKTNAAAALPKQGTVKVDQSASAVQKTLLAPPNANGQRAKIEGPSNTAEAVGNAPVFDGSGRLVSGNGR